MSTTPNRNKPKTLIHISDDKVLPSQFELAMIAANLAKNKDVTPEELLDSAVKIWNAAGRSRKNYEMRAIVTVIVEDVFKEGDHPTRNEFFKALLKKSKYRSDRIARIGKAYIRKLYFEKFHKEPSEKQFEDYYASWSPGTASKANELVNDFDNWRRENISEARAKAGRSRRRKFKTRDQLTKR